nr:immunoglobulin heavy chain junction region [Mus musculus]NSM08670.1 immunoglobulin heavy chain junction region [Mus musculus]
CARWGYDYDGPWFAYW